MPSRKLAAAFLIVAAVLATHWRASTAEDRQGAKSDPAKLQERVRAAQKVYELSLEAQQHGVANIDQEHLYRWSVRWMEAEREAAQKQPDRITALARHWKRTQSMKEIARQMYEARQASATEIAAAEYFCLEAEAWLTSARDGQPR